MTHLSFGGAGGSTSSLFKRLCFAARYFCSAAFRGRDWFAVVVSGRRIEVIAVVWRDGAVLVRRVEVVWGRLSRVGKEVRVRRTRVASSE